MATVYVLKPGYAQWAGPTRQRADGTITLVRSSINVIIDTGIPQDKARLLSLLSSHGLSPENIAVVICTHGHSDHIGNNGLFPNAKFIVSYDISVGDLYTFHPFHESPYLINDEIEVSATPGHTAQDISGVNPILS